MCKYLQTNLCLLTKEQCPWVFFCNREQKWKPNRAMPSKCKVKENLEIPEGYCKVVFERHGYLYVNLGTEVKKILNPFNDVPLYVKVKKTKKGKYKLSQ